MIRVVTTALTSPLLLRAQAEALRRHLRCHYELLVVNDARPFPHFSNLWTAGMPDRIRRVARSVGAKHIRLPQRLHANRELIFPDEPERFRQLDDANSRCADAVQFGVNAALEAGDDPIMLIDADIAPFQTFNPYQYLDKRPVWGVPQNRGGYHYLWNGLILIDPTHALAMDKFNLDCGAINGVGVDVGGMLYEFVRENDFYVGEFHAVSAGNWCFESDPGLPLPDSIIQFMRWDCVESTGFRISEVYCNALLHMRAGGNWDLRPTEYAQERITRYAAALRGAA